jgi:hypothetical protein
MSHKDCKIKNYSGFGLKPIFYSSYMGFGCLIFQGFLGVLRVRVNLDAKP